MVLCKCGNEHDGSFGSGKFCSRSCANSRTHSTETKKKISESITKNTNSWSKNWTPEMLAERKLNLRKTYDKKLLDRDWDSLGVDSLKKRIILEEGHICKKCKNTLWLGKPITLELEHKDGNHDNNKRENLECLCPNCHSLTDTWRGRNIKRRNKITDLEICEAFVETGNIRQCLLKLGLAAKGGNYQKVKNALVNLGL